MLRLIQRYIGISKRRTLYLIRGVSGTGKSSLADTLTRFNVAADDYPGLYANGEYQGHLQKPSHQWCFSRVEDWMRQKRNKIAVHNTFSKQRYFEDYLALAKDYGYTVQVIHTEGIMLPSGKITESVHNVPADVLQRQRENWQPFSP